MEDKKIYTLSFKINEELNKRIEERATEEKRNKSNFVIKILTEYLDKVDEAKKIINNKN